MKPERALYYTDDVERRAIRAYFRRFGKDAPIPSGSVDWLEFKEGRVICLSNANGCLAHYRVTDCGGVRYLEPDAAFVEVMGNRIYSYCPNVKKYWKD